MAGLMHAEALAYVAGQAQAHGPYKTVVEIGSRDVNGTPRALFPGAAYLGVDLAAGPGVDVVADAAGWRPDEPVEAVLCLEVLEHATDPAALIDTAWDSLRPGGRLIVTAATDPRPPHSGHDGGPLQPGEWYQNVPPAQLALALDRFIEVEIEIDDARGDIYASAVRPG